MFHDEITGGLAVQTRQATFRSTGVEAQSVTHVGSPQGADEVTSLTRLPTGTTARPIEPAKHTEPPAPSPRAFRTEWLKGKEATARMMKAAQSGEVMELTVATDDLDQHLNKLWDVAEQRDVNWQTILNHVQGMVRQLFQEHRVESLKPEQCRCFHEIVSEYIGPATKTVDDLNAALRLIRDAGFDPYAGISGEPAA